MGVGGVKVEGAVLAGVTLDAGNIFLQKRLELTWTKTPRVSDPGKGGEKKSHLAETPPGVWVAHFRGDPITVTVAGYALGEAVVSRSAAVTLSASDSRLATAKKEPRTHTQGSESESIRTCVVCFHSLALSGEAVAVGPRHVFDPSGGALAAVAAQQGMVAEGLGLARAAGRPHRLRRADAFPRHLVAQTAAALARCR